MKKIMQLLTLIALVIITGTGCSNDSAGGGGITDPFGTGGLGGNTGGVTFTIASKSDQQGGTIFSAKPSAAVKVSKVTIGVPAQQYSETFQFDDTIVLNANVAVDFIQYPAGSGVTSGQQWTFQIEGTLANNNQAYNVTSNYTIP